MALNINTDAARLLSPLPLDQPRRPLADFSATISQAAARPGTIGGAAPAGLPPIPGLPPVLPAAPPAPAEPGIGAGARPRPAPVLALPDLGFGGTPQRLVDLLTQAQGRAEVAVVARRAATARILAPRLNSGRALSLAEGLAALAPAEAGAVATQAQPAFAVEPPAAPPVAFAPTRPAARAPEPMRGIFADLNRVAERIQQLNAVPALAAARAAAPAITDRGVPAARRAPLLDQQV